MTSPRPVRRTAATVRDLPAFRRFDGMRSEIVTGVNEGPLPRPTPAAPRADASPSTANKLIKGTMLIDQVRMIRKSKLPEFRGLFTDAEWRIIMGPKILPSSWYPLSLYEKCGLATFNLLAGRRLDVVESRGRARGRELFQSTYRAMVEGADPMRAVERFVRAYSLLFNFTSLLIEPVSATEVRLHRQYDSGVTSCAYCHQLLGHLEALLEASGAKNYDARMVSKTWEGDERTTFALTWTN